jgi:hypothetical protein
MVEAGGVEKITHFENTQVIENTKRQKRENRRKRHQLERIWNTESFQHGMIYYVNI